MDHVRIISAKFQQDGVMITGVSPRLGDEKLGKFAGQIECVVVFDRLGLVRTSTAVAQGYDTFLCEQIADISHEKCG